MLKRFSGFVLICSTLFAFSACKKASAPTVPDTVPGPVAKPPGNPNSNPNTGTPNTQALDSSLPNPPTQKPLFANTVAVATIRTANLESLKQIGLGLLNFHDTYQGLPIGIADKSGKIGLSWRVAILPFIEQNALYQEFHLDEPWDSEHNKRLISKMPKLYAPARTDTFGYTFYRSFSGNNTVMPPPAQPLAAGKPGVGASMASISDGTSNTLFVAEAYDPVIWTKPDAPFTPGSSPKLGGGVFSNGFCALFGDNNARFLPMGLPEADLSSLILTNDGKVVILP